MSRDPHPPISTGPPNSATRGLEALIRSLAYNTAFKTLLTLPPLPAGVIPDVLLPNLYLSSLVPMGLLSDCAYIPVAEVVYATVVSRPKRPGIDARRLSFSSASVCVEMGEGSEL